MKFFAGLIVIAALVTAGAQHNVSSPSAAGVSLGNSVGKTIVMKTGSLATTAATADQIVLTYTVSAGKTFYLQYFDLSVRLTTFSSVLALSDFGDVSLESPAGTKLYTERIQVQNTLLTPIAQQLQEPLPILSGAVIRVVCTPATATGFTWRANFGGYEK